MGEGAGVVVLEEYEHAKARGAQIYARADRLRPVRRRLSHHRAGRGRRRRVPLHEGGDQARRAFRRRDIDYINAHGTSTPLGDEIELKAVERLVGNAAGQITMSSTKSSIGHLLGAAGAVEAIFSMLAHPRSGRAADASISTIRRSRRRSISCRTRRRKRTINVALSNSFGFGGTNASLVFRRMPDERP